MKTLLQTIESAHYAATPAQVEALAELIQTGARCTGVYLQTLIAATQAALGSTRRPTRAAVLAAVEAAHTPLYEAVQRGVAKGSAEAVTPRELASRSGFARTSASALRKFVESGGDVRALVPGKVTRRMLRPEGPMIPAGTSRAERAVLTAIARIQRVTERAAGRDVGEARALLETAVEVLSARLDALSDGNAHPAAQPAADAPVVVATRLHRTSHGSRVHA